MATVLIIGASKGIGLETVKCTLKAGHQVRAMARSAVRIPGRHANLETVTGDALDASAVSQALTDVDVAIQTLGVTARPGFLFKPVRLFSDATRVLVAAMAETGVRRLICVTGLGAGDSRDRGGVLYNTAFHLFLGRVYDDKDVQERIIRDSKLDWTIARPGILTRGPMTGRYRVLDNPDDWRCGFISRTDVADFLVKQIDDDQYLGKTPVLIQ
jgi:putative NADH-flavin reductase